MGGMGITLLTLERDYFACMVWFYRTFACKFIISNNAKLYNICDRIGFRT